MQLSSDQANVHDAIIDFIRGARGSHITVGGYAGTGKTTIINEVVNTLGSDGVAFCAYTGKAAQVLKTKLDCDPDYVGTIHRFIYQPLIHNHNDACFKSFVGKKRLVCEIERMRFKSRFENDEELDKLHDEYKLIIVDEASMITKEIFDDLMRLELPIVFVGDHGQLPPVKGSFNLMENPQYRLDKIHRQAENNPIIKLSMLARNNEAIPFGNYGPGVRKVRGLQAINDIELNDVLLLCGLNKTRNQFNSMARTDKRDQPEVGEKVICLKNNAEKGIFNGMVGFVTSCEVPDGFPHHYDMSVDFREDGQTYEGRVFKHQFGQPKTLSYYPGISYKYFGDQFDFGYCMTVHKAQGSEADSVVFISEPMRFLKQDYPKWLYTAITRARKELLIVQP